jgi:hypothetical protein
VADSWGGFGFAGSWAGLGLAESLTGFGGWSAVWQHFRGGNGDFSLKESNLLKNQQFNLSQYHLCNLE